MDSPIKKLKLFNYKEKLAYIEAYDELNLSSLNYKRAGQVLGISKRQLIQILRIRKKRGKIWTRRINPKLNSDNIESELFTWFKRAKLTRSLDEETIKDKALQISSVLQVNINLEGDWFTKWRQKFAVSLDQTSEKFLQEFHSVLWNSVIDLYKPEDIYCFKRTKFCIDANKRTSKIHKKYKWYVETVFCVNSTGGKRNPVVWLNTKHKSVLGKEDIPGVDWFFGWYTREKFIKHITSWNKELYASARRIALVVENLTEYEKLPYLSQIEFVYVPVNFKLPFSYALLDEFNEVYMNEYRNAFDKKVKEKEMLGIGEILKVLEIAWNKLPESLIIEKHYMCKMLQEKDYEILIKPYITEIIIQDNQMHCYTTKEDPNIISYKSHYSLVNNKECEPNTQSNNNSPDQPTGTSIQRRKQYLLKNSGQEDVISEDDVSQNKDKCLFTNNLKDYYEGAMGTNVCILNNILLSNTTKDIANQNKSTAQVSEEVNLKNIGDILGKTDNMKGIAERKKEENNDFLKAFGSEYLLVHFTKHYAAVHLNKTMVETVENVEEKSKNTGDILENTQKEDMSMEDLLSYYDKEMEVLKKVPDDDVVEVIEIKDENKEPEDKIVKEDIMNSILVLKQAIAFACSDKQCKHILREIELSINKYY